MDGISRRGLVGGLLGGVASVGLGGLVTGAEASKRKGTIRVAHMTDFHVQPELNAPKGMAMALDHAHALKPDLILGGGDLIMDGFAQDEARTALQWKLFQKIAKAHIHVPVHYAIGNHDVWGWNKKDSHTTGSEAEWDKKWFLDALGYQNTYYSFDHGAWHFVVLDNILLTPDGYNGMLGDAQREWLDADLAATKKPTVLLTHIPMLSVTTLANSYSTQSGEWNVGGDSMTKDLDDLFKLFAKHRHVKLALSGHEHMIDRVDFKGVTYLCSGAVCGSWWNGPNDGFDPGYRLLDLHEDGTFEEKMLFWGWDKSFLA